MKAPYYPGRYDLMENFAENFTTANENNKESVFELQYSSDGELTWGNESGINLGNSLPTFVGPVAASGWAKLMPSSFAIGQFVKEERPPVRIRSMTNACMQAYSSIPKLWEM